MTITTVGILHPGELGAVVADAVASQVERVVTCDVRSAETRQRALDHGLIALPSEADVATAADVVVSVVPPAAAVPVASSCAEAGPASGIYVDLNSIGPELGEEVAATVEAAGFRYVAGSVHGSARHPEQITVYLSGASAPEIAELLRGSFRVETLGAHTQQAKVMKVLLGATTKAVAMLYVEVAVMAERADSLADFRRELEHFYPELGGLVDRMLPTYPDHLPRRIDELRSVVRFADATGADHAIIDAALARLAALTDRWSTDVDRSPEELTRAAARRNETDEHH